MKKVLFLLLASFLVLASCGQEESKLEDKKETKSSSKESKKDEKKSKEDKSDEEKSKTDDKNSEQVADNENVNTEEQPSTQQNIQSQEQSKPYEPTDQEKMEANAKVAKEHGYTGIPNGDAGLLDSDAAYKEVKEQEAAEQAEQEAKEAELQEEYFDLSDKMYGEKDYSDEEMEAMERRQNEILDEVEPIN
ncbi:hypothetical protein [Staphylococcus sp. GDY8P31P]|uniref:hypothetical protein n=1 Tax=Staphylococcus sp. GDY8P31P TaxID=2804115 RepID=UPI001AEC26E0|nr:hypothetical protein [Staphylococcus sp. GDY8P31P]